MVILGVSSRIRPTESVCLTGVLQAGAPSTAPVGDRAVTPTGINEKVVGLAEAETGGHGEVDDDLHGLPQV